MPLFARLQPTPLSLLFKHKNGGFLMPPNRYPGRQRFPFYPFFPFFPFFPERREHRGYHEFDRGRDRDRGYQSRHDYDGRGRYH
ncbi:MAG: hypothetical protein P4M02_09315 [Clostridia bacterium]|nr:hypothetical protein [Clostridia bacterium]